MTTASAKLGWIGMGRMGYAMAYRLLQGGCDLSVWNRTRAKAEPLAAFGGKIVGERVELAPCDIVFTMVSTTADLQEVLFAPDGLLSGSARPKLVIDCSSISQEGSAKVRAELTKFGVAYLCAPVSGNAKVAKAAKLSVVASGPKAQYDRAEPYLKMFGRSAIYLGEGELARVWKIAHNTLFGVIIQSLCEVTVLAEKAGIPRHVFLQSINNSVLGSMYTTYKTPVLTNLSFENVTFTPKLLLKDMDLGLEAGHVHGVPMPTASATRESVASVVGRGHDNVDFAILLQEIAANAGLKIQPENVKMSDGLES